MTTDNRVVLYVDILGFAALTESCPIDVDGLKSKDRVFSPSLGIDSFLQASRNPLTKVFSGFHYSLTWILFTAKLRHPLTAISFSDSAFVVTTYVYEAVNIANEILHSLLPQKIPVRIGIAYGSFAALRFRSDITADSGDHAAQFLGTSIVRAHAAESCGIKGLRILLHPSVMPLLEDTNHNPKSIRRGSQPFLSIECAGQEQTNKSGITHEINYWSLQRTKEAEAWHGLQDMWSHAPEDAAHHYLATAEAINRMRIARGCEGLRNLRRRTLPKGMPT